MPNAILFTPGTASLGIQDKLVTDDSYLMPLTVRRRYSATQRGSR